ncbi:MAG: pantoate--beta-alanine ligase [Armatimonadia bacterium]
MRIEKRIGGVRAFVQAARRENRSVGLVPTMGAFHEGHLSLIRRSVNDNDVTIVSIFVNPTQFGPNEDYQAYPRDLERDAVLAERQGVAVVFAPDPQEMYPPDFSTWIQVAQVSEGLCGSHRPGHFRGVATVVCKLFNIVQPDRAYFGEKDFQQLQVIRRMVRDLDLPLGIVPVPTTREADGLAMSSRNKYLTAEQRKAAPKLHQALQAGAKLVAQGATGGQAVEAVQAELAREKLITPQYVVAVDPDNLTDKSDQGRPLVLAAAVLVGNTRLIDNVKVNGDSGGDTRNV